MEVTKAGMAVMSAVTTAAMLSFFPVVSMLKKFNSMFFKVRVWHRAMSYTYNAQLVTVTEECHVILCVDLGFRIQVSLEFRLSGIKITNMSGRFEASKSELENLLRLGDLRITTEKPDVSGLWGATICVKRSTFHDLNVNDALKRGGFAV